MRQQNEKVIFIATIKQCDRCGSIIDVKASISINRERKCLAQFDGLYTSMVKTEYDVCAKCARDIELLFITAEKADEVLIM